MKKDDNTTNYSARLVCEKCGYVFGLKEVAYIEHGFSEPWNSPRVEVKCYNEIYPKYCPKCKREAQQISYSTKLSVYCAPTEEQADILIKKRKEEELRKGIEELRKINNCKATRLVSPENMTKILSYCNADIAFTECCEDAPLCWDCEAIKDYCSIGNCPHKDSVSPKYFEKHGLYPCAVFYTLSNANEFAKYLFHRIINGRSDRVSLLTVSSAISRNNGYTCIPKAESFKSIGAMPQTNEGRCGWTRKELETYGIAIDFEKHPNTNEDIFCVYLPIPKYLGEKKEDK